MSSIERLVLDHSPQMLLLVDPDNLQIVFANRAAWQTLGFAEEDLIGKAITDVESSLQDVFYWEDVRNGQCSGIALQEGLYLCCDGTLLPVDKSVQILEHEGHPHLLIQAQDIRVKRRTESDLAQSMSQLRATLESTGNGIMVMDLLGGIASMNRMFSQMWDIPEHLLLDSSDAEIIDCIVDQVIEGPTWRSRLQPTIDTAATKDVFQLKDGRVFECESRPQYLDERVTGRVFSSSDITDRVRIQRELTDAAVSAEAANVAKSRFLSTMSHELRTPMNAILGFSRLLKDQGLPPQHEATARKIVTGCERLLGLLNGIIDYSELEGGGSGNVQKVSLDLSRMLRDASSSAFLSAKSKGLETSLGIASDLPARVLGDAKLIRRILEQFLNNAVKFTAKGAIGLAAANAGDAVANHVRLRICVSDTGIGVAPELQKRLFQPFLQVEDAADRKFEGIGLGLALTRELARLINGEIGFESEPGQGSSFWMEVTLPVDDSILPAPEPAENNFPGPSSQKIETAAPTIASMPEHLRATMEMMEKLLHSGDTRAAILFVEAEPGLRPWLGERYDVVSELINTFNYDQAGLLLKSFKNDAGAKVNALPGNAENLA